MTVPKTTTIGTGEMGGPTDYLNMLLGNIESNLPFAVIKGQIHNLQVFPGTELSIIVNVKTPVHGYYV